ARKSASLPPRQKHQKRERACVRFGRAIPDGQKKGKPMIRRPRAWQAISSAVESAFLSSVMVVVLANMAWAGELNRSNSLTIGKDSGTALWTATCEISVGGLDVNQIYSGRMRFEFLPSGAGTSTVIFDDSFQVDPANRTSTDSVAGIYEVSAKLKGHEVLVH